MRFPLFNLSSAPHYNFKLMQKTFNATLKNFWYTHDERKKNISPSISAVLLCLGTLQSSKERLEFIYATRPESIQLDLIKIIISFNVIERIEQFTGMPINQLKSESTKEIEWG